MKYRGMLTAPSMRKFWNSLGRRTSSHLPPRGDDFPRLVVIHPLQQGLVQQCLKIIFAESHQRAFGGHGHGGIALRLRDQGLLAEAVARPQFGELDAFLVQRRLARHDAFAGHHDVEVIAFGALLDDDVARRGN